MAKTLLSQVKGFVTSQNNSGKNGLVFVQRTIDHMFEHGDWTPLAWLLNQSQGTDKARLRAIVGACVGGVTLKTSSKEAKAQPSGMIISLGDNAAPSEGMTILRKLIEEGASFRGKEVSSRLLKKEPAPFDLHKYAGSVFRKLEKEGVNVSALFNEMKPMASEAKVENDAKAAKVALQEAI